MKETLISRTYRIRKSQDKAIKKMARKGKCSESSFLRYAIDSNISMREFGKPLTEY